MALDVTKPIVWAGDITDEPGGLAETLGGLAGTGANLEFVIARRRPEAPGGGVVFVSPIEGRAAQTAAKNAGMSKADVPTLRVEGPDRPGIGTVMLQAVASEGINLRGVSAAVLGRRFVAYFGFDSAADATRAARALKGVDTGRTSGRSRSTAPRRTGSARRRTAGR